MPGNPSTPQPRRFFTPQSIDDDNDLSTLPDPRSRAMSPASINAASPPHHPDLDEEVATLSTKLINAINHQTTLDDNLSATRMELEKARERIRQLEMQVEEQREMLAGDVWVRRKTVEAEKATLVARANEEKNARLEVELQKKKIEQELENLTAALFEEANKMVIQAKEEARAEQEALQRKNDQIKAQLADTEGLLLSQQEQLAELKHVMEQMTFEKDEQVPPTVPSSPGFSRFDDAPADSPSAGAYRHSLSVPLSPSYPTSFTHLLQPVLRTDLAAYADFRELVRTSKRLSGQRVLSGASGSGLTSLGVGLGSVASYGASINGSTTSVSTAPTPPATSPQTPNTPASSVSAGSPASSVALLPHLKETKFYKRVLTEDIEPTLRLDTAPGLSWLARRSVVTAMTEGSLVVEPAPATTTGRFGKVSRPDHLPCSLCGEARNDEEHLRTHRFRVSESDSTQSGYALCSYCLARVRSTCDFLGFLRIVKDGHWRADDDDAEKAAWEESVRLREHMFWSRIGGGVLPTSQVQQHPISRSPSMMGEKSPRPSQDRLDPSSAAPGPEPHVLVAPPKLPDRSCPEEIVQPQPTQLAESETIAVTTESAPAPAEVSVEMPEPSAELETTAEKQSVPNDLDSSEQPTPTSSGVANTSESNQTPVEPAVVPAAS